jgi:hypothetical protein
MRCFIFLVFFVNFSISLIAQGGCDFTHVLFRSPIGVRPQRIQSLGSNPQMQCLRGVTDTQNFFAALRTCLTREIYKTDLKELNEIFKQIGFTEGVLDNRFTEESLRFEGISSGTRGMLGYKRNGEIGYVYAELVPQDSRDIPGWRITGPTGCYVYIFTACGNAFYPEKPVDTASCPRVNFRVDGDTLEVGCRSVSQSKKIRIENWIELDKGNQKSRKSFQGSGSTKFGPFLFNSYDFEISHSGVVDSSYKIFVSGFNYMYSVCKDTSLNVQVELTKVGQTSVAVSTTDTIIVKKNIIRVDKKNYRRFKKSVSAVRLS